MMKRSGGFTLLEIIISLAVLTIVMLPLFTHFMGVERIQRYNLQLQQSMSYLKHYAEYATATTPQAGPLPLSYDLFLYRDAPLIVAKRNGQELRLGIQWTGDDRITTYSITLYERFF